MVSVTGDAAIIAAMLEVEIALAHVRSTGRGSQRHRERVARGIR